MYYYPYYPVTSLKLKVTSLETDQTFIIDQISLGRIITKDSCVLLGRVLIEVKDRKYILNVTKNEMNEHYLYFDKKNDFLKWLTFIKAINNLYKKNS